MTGERTAQDGACPVPVLDELCRSAERLARLAGDRLSRIDVRSGSTAVVVEWREPPERAARPDPPGPAVPGTAALDEAVTGAAREPAPPDTTHVVRAPSVGTFYHAPDPGAPPFVSPGDHLTAGRQVGILEVMKLMTPIECETAGRVTEILVGDGEPVEYGQPLIALDTARAPALTAPAVSTVR